MGNCYQKWAIFIENGQFSSKKMVNFNQKWSILIKNGQFWSKMDNFDQKWTILIKKMGDFHQKWAIFNKNGQFHQKMGNCHQKWAIFIKNEQLIKTEQESTDRKVGQRDQKNRVESVGTWMIQALSLKQVKIYFMTTWKINFKFFDQNRDVIDHFKPNFDFFRH